MTSPEEADEIYNVLSNDAEGYEDSATEDEEDVLMRDANEHV